MESKNSVISSIVFSIASDKGRPSIRGISI